MDEKNKAADMIKTVYDDGEMTINGRSYVFGAATHRKRLAVFSFLSKITPQLEKNDMSFLGWSEWETVEKIMNDMILLEDMQISKRQGHWNKYPGDFLMFATIGMSVISYPFLAGSPTD